VDLAYHVHVRPVPHPALPDGRAGIVWLSDGTLRVCGPETRAWRPDRTGVAVTGLRLTAGAAQAVLGVPAVDLLDRRVELADLWGAAAGRLTDGLSATGDDARRQVRLLESLVRARSRSGGRIDPVARHVATRLGRAPVRISELAREVGLSERQLHRRSLSAFGYSPATLARVLRLQRFLHAGRRPGAARPLAELAALAGYADQSHLARDCRALTGLPASALLLRAVA
jgi:AraC-like DNA-binding protein